ncbi:DUF4190 domain-containing protein [Propioniciclava soli]|uniref:DUF4190 domain-containing protein n=1 Tax=Propioniciclava soli TaxID=2775081 RepID=UPI001E2DE041|nr:DUF4190 domain-containing protein [Propioniciclava soli]
MSNEPQDRPADEHVSPTFRPAETNPYSDRHDEQLYAEPDQPSEEQQGSSAWQQPEAPAAWQQQQGYQPAPAYGQGYPQGYAGGYAQPEHPQATTILILGIVGLFVAVTGPFAWVMGNKARREVAAGQFAPSTSLTVGWVLGIISSIYLAVMALFLVLMIVSFGLLAANG